jgi:ribulose-bisphosphate carboxylase large chain
MTVPRIDVVYRLGVESGQAAHRARLLAIEQSIEMPVEAVSDTRVLDDVLARVERIEPQADGTSLAYLGLSGESVCEDAGQMMNMLFGNCSLQPDVELVDIEVPASLAQAFGGPNLGIDGLRRLTGVHGRPLTCSALKPIGSTIGRLAELCRTFAQAGIDVIKDDHGWANPRSAPFAERVAACQQVVRDVNALKREHPDLAFIAHPALGGAGRIAPAVLLGKLFRLFGADAAIFPNHGGRFTYAADVCQTVAQNCRAPWHGLRPALPVPAGGMSVERVPEIKREYGVDTMLLIGGSLLIAGERLGERSRAFVESVAAVDQVAA